MRRILFFRPSRLRSASPRPADAPRASRLRLLLFASGDFAFNLYWQSVMVFLLFYYTEALQLPVEAAALTYLVASVWDGIVNFVAGALIDSRRDRGGFRRYLVLGAVPLGVAFMLAFAPPPFAGIWVTVTVLAGHLAFRTAYALVNVPYLAMTARVSLDSGDRRLMAAMRMLFGTAALVTVTLGTSRIGGWMTADAGSAGSYFAAAAVFALVATLLLLAVGLGIREVAVDEARVRPSIAACLASLARNRAFVTLNAATVAMIVAATVLAKSVLYYYKYVLADEAAGGVALAAMGVAGALSVPAWVLVSRAIGNRATWFAAAGPALVLLAAFAAVEVPTAGAMRAFLMAMQVSLTGLNIVAWAMLPNTIEYGERTTGLRVEGTVFGLAALLQRVAIGAATGILGLSLAAIGYTANAVQAPATLSGLRWTIALVPFGFLLLSIFFMALNPLHRRAHAAIVAELARRREPGDGGP